MARGASATAVCSASICVTGRPMTTASGAGAPVGRWSDDAQATGRRTEPPATASGAAHAGRTGAGRRGQGRRPAPVGGGLRRCDRRGPRRGDRRAQTGRGGGGRGQRLRDRQTAPERPREVLRRECRPRTTRPQASVGPGGSGGLAEGPCRDDRKGRG